MTTLSLVVLSLASAGAAPQGVLLDFMSTSCPPCMEMNPIVSKLHQQGYPVRKVDVNKHPELAQKYGITNIPAFVLVVNDKEVNRIVGRTTEGQLKRLLAQIPTEPAKPEILAELEAKPTAPTKSKPKKILVNPVDERKGIQIPFLNKKPRNDHAILVESTPARETAVRANNDTPEPAPRQPTGPVASSVRIRVKDGSGTNFGSGTIVASEPGRAYVLACGHIFRDVDKATSVEVDVFSGTQSETFVGTVVRYDLTSEVGLMAISPEKVLPVAKIATADVATATGDCVFSVGCGGGDAPAMQRLEVKGLNLYRGPDTVECTGVPAQGRSGGGLFDNQGRVIGVCFAADPDNNRGIYAGLKPIYQLLDQAELSYVYRGEAAPVAKGEAKLASMEQRRDGSGIHETVREQPGDEALPVEGMADANRAAEIQAAVENAEEAEVVCIIRPLNGPDEASRVVIINRASSRFVNYLQGELKSQPHPTMARQSSDAAAGDDESETRTARRPLTDSDASEDLGKFRPYRRSAASRQ